MQRTYSILTTEKCKCLQRGYTFSAYWPEDSELVTTGFCSEINTVLSFIKFTTWQVVRRMTGDLMHGLSCCSAMALSL